MKRHAVLYLATLIVLVPVDVLFLGFVAKGFFTSEVGDMLGEVRLAPAILFYLLYVTGVVVFVSGPPNAAWRRLCFMARCSDCFAMRRSN